MDSCVRGYHKSELTFPLHNSPPQLRKQGVPLLKAHLDQEKVLYA